jgi:hypothetical protein
MPNRANAIWNDWTRYLLAHGFIIKIYKPSWNLLMYMVCYFRMTRTKFSNGLMGELVLILLENISHLSAWRKIITNETAFLDHPS